MEFLTSLWVIYTRSRLIGVISIVGNNNVWVPTLLLKRLQLLWLFMELIVFSVVSHLIKGRVAKLIWPRKSRSVRNLVRPSNYIRCLLSRIVFECRAFQGVTQLCLSFAHGVQVKLNSSHKLPLGVYTLRSPTKKLLRWGWPLCDPPRSQVVFVILNELLCGTRHIAHPKRV